MQLEHAAHTALGDCYAAIGVWEAFFELYLHRPRLMKEALEKLTDEQFSKSFGYPDQVREIALKGLVGE